MDARPPRAAAIAARVRGRSSASLPISVRSRSQANASMSRGKSAREDQPVGRPATTYAATSAICCGVSWPLNDGITPLPFVTRSTTRSSRRLRLVEVRPDRPGRARRPSACGSSCSRRSSKTCLPAAGVALRLRRCVGTVPDDGLRRRASPSCPGRSPASTRPQAATIRARRRTGASLLNRARTTVRGRPASAASALPGVGGERRVDPARAAGPASRIIPSLCRGRAAGRRLPVPREAHRQAVRRRLARRATTIRDSRSDTTRAGRPGEDRRRVAAPRRRSGAGSRKTARSGVRPLRDERRLAARAVVGAARPSARRSGRRARAASRGTPSARGRRRAPRSAGSRPAGTSRARAGSRPAAGRAPPSGRRCRPPRRGTRASGARAGTRSPAASTRACGAGSSALRTKLAASGVTFHEIASAEHDERRERAAASSRSESTSTRDGDRRVAQPRDVLADRRRDEEEGQAGDAVDREDAAQRARAARPARRTIAESAQ